MEEQIDKIQRLDKEAVELGVKADIYNRKAALKEDEVVDACRAFFKAQLKIMVREVEKLNVPVVFPNYREWFEGIMKEVLEEEGLKYN
jgi:hypothetical protein